MTVAANAACINCRMTTQTRFTGPALPARCSADSCQCRDYPNRKKTVPDCVFLTPEIVDEVDWLPVTCAYRLVAEGSDLYWWHPLVSGSPETVHEAGISVRGKVTAFDHDLEDDDDYLDHMVMPSHR